MKNFPKSRSYALKALKVRPDEGSPLIIIGDLYAASACDCGDDELTRKVAYWAAVDKYYKAKKIDPSLKEIADSRISSYSAHFPKIETIFFENLNVGDTYKVECWINETTIIRAAK